MSKKTFFILLLFPILSLAVASCGGSSLTPLSVTEQSSDDIKKGESDYINLNEYLLDSVDKVEITDASDDDNDGAVADTPDFINKSYKGKHRSHEDKDDDDGVYKCMGDLHHNYKHGDEKAQFMGWGHCMVQHVKKCGRSQLQKKWWYKDNSDKYAQKFINKWYKYCFKHKKDKAKDYCLQFYVLPSSATKLVSETQQYEAWMANRCSSFNVSEFVDWKVSDPTIASIDAAGLATALSAGDVSINASQR
jgi:hypothetical protein